MAINANRFHRAQAGLYTNAAGYMIENVPGNGWQLYTPAPAREWVQTFPTLRDAQAGYVEAFVEASVEYLPEATAPAGTGSGAYVPDADEVEAIAARYGIPAEAIETTEAPAADLETTAPRPLPTPLGPGSQKLARGRVQVDVARPNPRGGYTVYRTGRFVTEPAARRWAEGVRGVGERASLTFYGPSDGWRAHAGANLTDAGWRTTRYADGTGGDPA